jgi:hypothetical protein
MRCASSNLNTEHNKIKAERKPSQGRGKGRGTVGLEQLCMGHMVHLELHRYVSSCNLLTNVTILPHFSTFLTHITLHALCSHTTYPHASIMCLQITELILAYITLTCIILFAHVLIWFLTAVLQLLITFL